MRFTALFHHVYRLETLRRAYFSLNPKAAAGVDGVTWQQYGEDLETNLQDLAASAEERRVPSAAHAADVYSQSRWAAETFRRHGAGRQDRPGRARRGLECHL